ncbi:MAG: hypothetical protein ACFFE1_16805 [Candidatus Thorarchaeota archaeon]
MSLEKRTICVSLIILTILSGAVHVNPVSASVPEDMQLVYDYGTQTLSVNVSHYTPNLKNHYIENIEVLKNGLSLLNRSYPNQTVNWGVYDTFSVSADVDDNLTVTAFCYKGQSLTRWLIVTSTVATNPQSSDTTTTTTTEPDGGPEPLAGGSLGTGIAIAAAAGVVIFLIVFFAWLNPDKVPTSLRGIGTRLKPGVSWLEQKLKGAFSWIKGGFGTLIQRIKTKTA